MRRFQESKILSDLDKKMVFLAGPRQVGKTWLAKSILPRYDKSVYLNYDNRQDREIILSEKWDPDSQLLVFDELHKYKDWKNFLKGMYDVKPEQQRILVTGSARLEVYSDVGDSLAGRYFKHRLMPLSLSELKQCSESVDLMRLFERGGYPEPYLAEDLTDADRWRQQYIESLITSDVLDFESILNLKAMRLIFELLRERVGSTISYQSIAEDVAVSPMTVKKYISILENLYVVFSIKPYSKNIARSLLKEPKIYFYDVGLVKGDDGARFENLMAVSLLKHVLGQQDYLGYDSKLQYIRTKDKREVDFVLVKDNRIQQLIEVKNSDTTLSKTLKSFAEQYGLKAVQVVKNARHSVHDREIPVLKAEDFLLDLYL